MFHHCIRNLYYGIVSYNIGLIFHAVFVGQFAYYFAWITCGEHMGRNIFYDNASRTYYTVVAYCYSAAYYNIGS